MERLIPIEAKMNLAVRGLSANLGEVPADTFFKDQHPDLKADTATRGSANRSMRRSETAGRPRSGGQLIANPPFNLKDWRGPDTAMRGSANLQPEGTPQVTSEARNKVVHDGRWNGYDTPPIGPALRGTNYAWILHMVSKLSDWSGGTKTTRQGCPKGERGGANQNSVAGFDFVHLRFAPVVLANGSMSTNTKGDCPARSAIKMPKAKPQSLTRQREIRQKLVENDLVDCMIALPGQLFHTTQIPVCLWFLTKNKKADRDRDYRNRETLTSLAA